LVVSLEIDPVTHEFARGNLERAGYRDVIVMLGDGGLGYPQRAPYDRIAVTAACADFPPPLLAQLQVGGRIIGPLRDDDRQRLTLITKLSTGLRRERLCDVLYVGLRGAFGA
jgi:protein-L-isoaspartate(D-aspartate) O-methyltransferase